MGTWELARKMGVLDYSGGLVVHTTAGIGSLVLAITSPIRLKNSLIFKSQEMIAFVGMLFITLDGSDLIWHLLEKSVKKPFKFVKYTYFNFAVALAGLLPNGF